MHISLPPDLTSLLKSYAKPRKKTASGVIQDALGLLFTIEPIDYEKQLALKFILEKHFVIPKSIPYASFYVFLYLLSKSYRDGSSKHFWTDVVYKDVIEKSHEEIFREVEREMKQMLIKEEDGKD